MAATVQQLERNVPLPAAMQGRWVGANVPSSELIIEGGEITCYGRLVDYDYKEVSAVDGALTVNLGVFDKTREDAFQRANITGLAISPEGDFLVWNVKSGDEFVRPVP